MLLVAKTAFSNEATSRRLDDYIPPPHLQVHGCGGLIQHQNVAGLQHTAGHADELLLPQAEVAAALHHWAIQAAWQLCDSRLEVNQCCKRRTAKTAQGHNKSKSATDVADAFAVQFWAHQSAAAHRLGLLMLLTECVPQLIV